MLTTNEQSVEMQHNIPVLQSVVPTVAMPGSVTNYHSVPVNNTVNQYPLSVMASPTFPLPVAPYICLPPPTNHFPLHQVVGAESNPNLPYQVMVPEHHCSQESARLRWMPEENRVPETRVYEPLKEQPACERANKQWLPDRLDEVSYRDKVLDDDISRERLEKHLMKEKVERWKIRDGVDSDKVEFQRLRTPHRNVIDAELNEVLHQRVIIIRGLTMEEFANQRLLEIMSRSCEFRVNFVFKENTFGDAVGIQDKVDTLWEGMMVLFMPSLRDAAEAAKYAQGIREDLSICTLQPDEDIGDLVEDWKQSMRNVMRQISDDVMIVCQLSENVTKEDLFEMFPDALDVVLPRDRIASTETEKLNARGYAFLTFGSRSRMLDAYNRYSSRQLVADDQVIHVIKYEAPKAIPTGYLRLKRRYRILCVIRDLKTAKAYIQPSNKDQLEKLQSDAKYWEGLVARDDDIREDLGLPAPSMEELQLLLDAPEPPNTPWSEEDVVILLNRSKQERTELDEIKQYHRARFLGRMKRRRLVRQRHWRAAAQQQAAVVGSNYDGTSYCTDNYSEHASDPYHAEVPPWVNDWQESGSVDARSSPPAKRTWKSGRCTYVSRRRAGWDHRASIRRATATVRRS